MAQQHHSQDSSAGRPHRARVEGRGDGGACVSVLAPSYNHAPVVAAAPRSVFQQTHAPARPPAGDAVAIFREEPSAPRSPTVLYRRAALERHGWNERARLEDYELYLRLSAEGDFAFAPRVLSAWRRHSANTSRDFVWMIEARLEAQRNAAAHLSLSDEELGRSQRALNFAGAEDLLRLGDKRMALKFLRRGLGGAPSPAALARVALRLVAPYSLVRWRRRRASERAARRYGKLPV